MRSSGFSSPQFQTIGRPAAQAPASERLAFIRKVYGLLFSGIIVFFATAAVLIAGLVTQTPVLFDLAKLSLLLPWWGHLLLILGGAWLAGSVLMKPGLNLLALYGMGALYGFLSVGLIAYALGVGGFTIILQALGLTTFVMGGLTGYVFVTRQDFSFLGGFLTVGLCLVIGSVIVLGFTSMVSSANLEVFHYAMSIIVVILFSGYVLFHTSQILHHYTTDMAVAAALALLIDFIAIFRSILFLLAAGRD